MIDHVGFGFTDFDTARSFFDRALAPIGASLLMMVPEEHTGGEKVGGYGIDNPVFWIHEGEPQTPPLHVAFTATSRAQVDAFYAAALQAGGEDNGAPGPRPHYHEHYYGAFVRGPDGHNIEVVCHKPE